jgi:hypothetical protein
MFRPLLSRTQDNGAVTRGNGVDGFVGAAADRLSLGPAGLDSPLLPSLAPQAWKKRWTGPIAVKISQNDIDFDALPPSGYYFGADLTTDRQGGGLYGRRDGKLVAWTDQDEPTPQKCNDLLVNAPAGEDSQYVQNPEAGRYYCLLTSNGSDPGRVVVFKVVQAITGGYSLEATVWNAQVHDAATTP